MDMTDELSVISPERQRKKIYSRVREDSTSSHDSLMSLKEMSKSGKVKIYSGMEERYLVRLIT